MFITRIRTRGALAVGAALTALVAGFAVVLIPAASQAATVGTITFDPASGNDLSSITLNTSALCPGGTNIQGTLNGGGFNNINVTANVTQSSVSTGSGYAISLQDTMRGFAQVQDPPVTTLGGKYDFTLLCKSGLTIVGDFVGSIFFSSNTAYASQASTTTALAATPASPQVSGTNVTFNATVAPAAAAGNVAFKDGANTLGTVAVSAGHAIFSTSTLAVGPHSITAQFTPTGAQYTGSTSSAFPYTISPLPAPEWKPTVYPTVRVGYTPACIAGFNYASTTAYQWYRDGVAIAGATAATYLIPETAYQHKLSCSVTATNSTGTATGTSSETVVGVGPALRATTLPTRSGTVKVGYTQTCKPGAWTPAATRYTYQWKRNGAAIRGATRTTYKLVTADRLRYITCTVTASRTGWTTASATTKAVKVP